MHIPKVSVVVPSYNHEKYIIDALESVVKQTFQDYELLILDDASLDQSPSIIEHFINNHPNYSIQFVRHSRNEGGVVTLNRLISMASGKYIALINSDDIWQPEKLSLQVDYLDQNPEVGAVFTHALMVDENKKPLNKEVFPFSDVFIQENRSRGQWLRRFFFDQNCLCHPSIVIRRDIYNQIGLYDPRFRQVPDLQMWIRLVKHVTIHIIEQPLVLLRWHAGNTSVVNRSNNIRGINELFHIYREFFDSMLTDLLVEGFQDLFINPDAREKLALSCETAFLYFKPTSHIKSIYYNIGLARLYELLGDSQCLQVLTNHYSFGYRDFYELAGQKVFDEDFLHIFITEQNPRLIESEYPQTSKLELSLRIKSILRRLFGRFPILYETFSPLWRKIRNRN